MDPNHWNNYNQSYGRMAPGSSVPGNPTSLNRFELPLLDQPTLTAPGLGALSPPLPAHSALSPPRLGPLPAMPYGGHPLHSTMSSSMSQFLDSMNSLQQTFGSQAGYKGLPVAPPAFNLEATSRSLSVAEHNAVLAEHNAALAEHTAALSAKYSSHVTSPGSTTPTATSMLFNTDPHTMKETAPTLGFSSGSPPPVSSESPKSWGLANFVPPASPFGSLPSEVPVTNTYSGGSSGLSTPEPPPAHTGSRPSTIQRNPYQSKSPYLEPAHSHSPRSSQASYVIESALRDLPGRDIPSAHSQSRAGTHQTYPEETRSHSSHHYTEPPRSVSRPSYSNSPPLQQSVNSHLPAPQPVTTYDSFPPSRTSTSSFSMSSSSSLYTTNSHHLEQNVNYDPVSPATPAVPDSQTTEAQSYSNMALQEMAERRAVKMQPLPEPHTPIHNPATPLQQSPQHVHMGAMQDMSPAQVQARLQEVSPVHTGVQQQSPMQPSPISVGSPQVPMSMGSPQTAMVPSSTVPPPPLPVQAVPDSTTKPKRGRGRRKKEPKGAAARYQRNLPAVITPVVSDQTFEPHTPTTVGQNFEQPVPVPPVNQNYKSATSVPPNSYQEPVGQSPMQHQYEPAPVPPPAAQEYQGYTSPNTAGTPQNYTSPVPARNYTSPQRGQNYASPQNYTSPAQPQSYTSPPQPQSCSYTSPQQSAPPIQTDAYEPKPVFTHDESIFMTNSFGNAFVNPNDFMPGNGDDQDMGLEGSNAGDHSPELKPKTKRRTKAEQKQMPTLNSDLEDEFAHLANSPVIPDPPPSPRVKRGRPKKVNKPKSPEPPAAPPNPVSPPPTAKPVESSFQSSFLSFLQGKKPETLSSVTNSTVGKKPSLPKYVPEPARTRRSRETRGSGDMSNGSNVKSAGSSDMISFSDDEDSAQNLSKTVQNVISHLSDDSAAENSNVASDPTVLSSEVVATGKIKMTIRRTTKRGPKSKKKHKSAKLEVVSSPVDGDDGEPPEMVINPIAEVPGVKPRTPSPPMLRQRSSRKAKEKVEQKRQEKQERKMKSTSGSRTEVSDNTKTKESKKKRGAANDSDSFVSDLSEEIRASSSESDVEKGYDSDKDPAWMPIAQNPMFQAQQPEKRPLSSGSEDEGIHGGFGRKGRGRGKRIRRSSSKPGRGRGRGRRRSSGVERLLADTVEPPLTYAPGESDEEPAHGFNKGDFVLDRKDMTNYEKYPIWKIDAGRLLQKYEPFQQDGKLLHRSLNTYSSWSDSIKYQFRAINVRAIAHNRGQETVEVMDHYKPKPPPQENQEEEDPLMQAFNVYMQIFISQALEPGFLGAVMEANDDYYIQPLQTVDSLIVEQEAQLKAMVNWIPEFSESVERFPCITVTERPDGKGHCEACDDPSQAAVQSVRLYGDPYDRDTLDTIDADDDDNIGKSQEFLVGKQAAEHLTMYHGLHHFKYNIYKRCLAKVNVIRDSGQKVEKILDQCLQNRTWVQKLFKDLKQLVGKENSNSSNKS